MKQIKWLDYTRGAAIILVVLGHAIAGVSVEAGSFFNIMYMIITGFHMPLFFLISGFLYNQKNKENTINCYFSDFEKKVIDLLIPYVLFEVLYCVVGYFTKDEKYTFEALIRSYYHPISHFWFIYVLFFVFMIIPIVLFIVRKEWIAVFVFLTVYMLIAGIEIEFPIVSIVYYSIFFLLGKAAAQAGIFTKKICHPIAFVFLLIVYLVYNYFRASYDVLNFRGLNILNAIIGMYVFVVGMVFLMNTLKVCQSFFCKLGKASILIYLVHSLFVSISRTLLIKASISFSPLIIILTTIIGTVIPLLIYLLGERFALISIFYMPRKSFIRIRHKEKREASQT